MADLITRVECRGGPWDGHKQKVPAGVDQIMVGPVQAAWVTETGIAPESIAGTTLHIYRRTTGTTDDGAVIYEYVKGAAQ